MDDRDEIAELRREVEQQRALLNASYGTTITLIDMLTRALEDKGALDRVTLKDLPGTSYDVGYTYDAEGCQLTAAFASSGQGITSYPPVPFLDPVFRS